MNRARLLVLASAVAMVGWGTILPYQYAYAANSRGWGAVVAAGASSLFSLGALGAAPLGGRLADRLDPVRVAVVAKLVAAAATALLVVADTPALFLTGMLVFGAGLTAAAPAQSVLVLRWVGSADRRRVFALQFTGSSVGMALGAFGAGYLVHLDRPSGMWPAFAAAAAGFALSALLVAAAGRGAPAKTRAAPPEGVRVAGGAAVRLILGTPALRWTALVTVTLALGFYAQFESGLPAYALTVLALSERTVGTAAAVNCLVIVALQMAVVRWTAERSAPSLLVVVGAIWVVSWGVLAATPQLPGIAGAMFVTAFGIFALGETMYAPVLNPLTAALAPTGMVGTTLGVFAALQTGVSAAGPLLAGLALGGGHDRVFVGGHAAVSLVAVLAALRLRRLLRGQHPLGAAPAVAAGGSQGALATSAVGGGAGAGQLSPASRPRRSPSRV